jgi:hypothetical protein
MEPAELERGMKSVGRIAPWVIESSCLETLWRQYLWLRAEHELEDQN